MKQDRLGRLLSSLPTLRIPKFRVDLQTEERTKKLSSLIGKGKSIAKEKITELGSWLVQELAREIEKFLQQEQDPLIQEVLKVFRERLASKPSEEEIAEIHEYMEALPERLKEDRCLVCFQSLTGRVLICPECKRGAHEDHMLKWLKTKPICPLCRRPVSPETLELYRL
ncbi:MAG: hypothetical protein ACFFBD_22445 [Candidatus Hodarchaeota archaeon]